MVEQVFGCRRVQSAAELAALVPALRGLGGGGDPAELVDQLRGLEELKSAAAAAQARVTACFAAHLSALLRAG